MVNRAEAFGDKVVYQIYIKSFSDSDGDGIGDLKGITQHLDYLQKLGIDYIWITPFFPSPQRDNGYDVSDYCAVDPTFGTMDDFDELVAEASRRGIGLMLDMVFNHTSTEHAWFKRALAGDEHYQAYYKFVDAEPGATPEDPGKPPTNWDSLFGGSAWEYVPELNKWYLHLFDVSQADLNWDNPEVRAELARVVRFWKDRGVAGYRFDVANFISKPDTFEDDPDDSGVARGMCFYKDGPHVHEYLKELVHVTGIEDMMTVGEMGSTTIGHAVRYTAPENRELTQIFNFEHMEVDYPDGKKWVLATPPIPRLREVFRRWEEEVTDLGGWNALFWSNHDQPRPNSRFGNVDTRENWRRSSELLATCSHLMRGTPYIFEGEELGMTNPGFTDISQINDVESVNSYAYLQMQGASAAEAFCAVKERSRDNARTPMQWDASDNAGFSVAKPWMMVAGNHTEINAAAEVDDPDSVFNYFRRLIALRKELPVIQRGNVRFLDTQSDEVIAFERTLADANDGTRRVVVACNFSGSQETALPAGEVEGGRLLLDNSDDWRRDGESDRALVLGPWTAVVLAW
jgi:trehalose-6-phosphate hydrolase